MRVTTMVHNLKLGFKSGGSRSRQDLDEVGDDDDLDCVSLDTPPSSRPASSLSDTRSARDPPQDPDTATEKEIKEGRGLLLDVFIPVYCDSL